MKQDNAPIVFFHKDQLLNPDGVNAGAEMATLCLARALVKSGRRVVVAAQLAPEFASRDLHRVHSDGVSYFDLGTAFDTVRAISECDRAFEASGYHLIVASRAQALLESRYNPKILSRLFISHEPAAGALGMQPAIIGRIADRVIAVSEAQRQGLIDAGCAPECIAVIPNGADLELFQPGNPETRNYDRLIFVGALVMDKGVHLLLEAFAQLKQRYPRLTLDVYGAAKMWGREDYFDLRQAAAIPGVKLHGAVRQSELATAYQQAGLLALPSMWFDSFPLTAVEAQVSGLPVLGSRNGGMKEIIRHDVTGRLLNEVSVKSIAEELEYLLSRPQLLKEMSRQALAQLRHQFSWDKIAEQVVALQNQFTRTKVTPMIEKKQKLGFLTTFNQRCGLAEYAQALLKHLAPGETSAAELTVLAEEVSTAELMDRDVPAVRRCWKRGAADLSKLETTIEQEQIDLLVLNCHYRFFQPQVIKPLIERCQRRGVRVVALLHNAFTVDPALRALVQAADCSIVHIPENRLELIANGAQPEKISLIELGVERVVAPDPARARRQLGIPADQKIVVSFGFVQQHKGLDEIIDAVHKVRARGTNAHLYLVGGVNSEDPTSVEYLRALKQLVQQAGLQSCIHFIDGYVPEEQVTGYLTAADAVVLNYRSQHYEGSAAVARAIGCGAPIITSLAPTFARLGNAVFHATAGYPLPLALELVLTSSALSDELRQNARTWAESNSWQAIAAQFSALFQSMGVRQAPERQAIPVASAVPPVTAAQSTNVRSVSSLRVLMQNRSNAFLQRGGDTVVMERLFAELAKKGVSVDIDLQGAKDPSDYDLVHLFNFATPEITRRLAERCVVAKTPYVVTTLYEDLPVFYHQMIAHSNALRTYVARGQERKSWDALAEEARRVPPAARWENSWTAKHAAGLLATGEHEAELILKDYPDSGNVQLCRLGCELDAASADPELFRREFGVSDFVLCVGRLETRKNQLMLLKALEDSDLTVVLASGGFTYQPEYEEACRNFKRKGKTLIVGRLDERMLASAYAASRVHVLPSFYEIPGLVSLEAARFGKNVVVTDRGTTRDYFGSAAVYCQPEDPKSILNSVVEAFYAVPKRELRERVESFTWARSATETVAAYQHALGAVSFQPAASSASRSTADSRIPHVVAGIEQARVEALKASNSVGQVSRALAADPEKQRRAEDLCDQGEQAIRSGNLTQAVQCYTTAIELVPQLGRAHRCLGVAALRSENYSLADSSFREALKIDPRDAKSVCGLGAICWGQGRQEEALRTYLQALEIDSCELAALLHLINAAYTLNRLGDLERALRTYVQQNPQSADMQYCLAGCLFKQGKLTEAASFLDRVLSLAPDHKDALELQRIIEKEAPVVERSSASAAGAGAISAGAPSTTLLRAKYHSKVEEELRMLEDFKDAKKYDEVISGVSRILNAEDATEDQQVLARLLRAEASGLSGNLAEAEAEFKALEQNRSWRHRALAGRGAIAAANEQWDDAESFFSRALTVVSDYDVALAGIGVCRLQRSEWQAAWDSFQRALSINPENVRALLGIVQLGYPLNRLRELEAAVKNFLEMHPANLSILYAHAGCLYAQGKIDEAIAELDKINLFDPNNALAEELRSKIVQEAQGRSAASGTV